ncbi:hypothetical protein ACLKA7_000455 [Drosophila subpalustris]
MPSTEFRFLSLLLVLATLSCSQAAPAADKDAQVEQLVRVYPISEQQYEKLLKLTNGKNFISEARLTSAGFSAVRNSLDSGWNSLLRIMGLTTTSRAEVAKIDIDGQPLCVMKRSIEPRAASDEESVINCIVVLKKDSVFETHTADNPNPSFAPYWYQEDTVPAPVQAETPQQLPSPEASPLKVKKLRNKPKSKSRLQQQRKKTLSNGEATRQYGSPFGSPYGSPYGGAYPYQNPYGGFSPYGSFGQQPGFGQFPAYGQQPFYPPSPFLGQPSPYNPYPFFEESEDEADEGDELEVGYEVDTEEEDEEADEYEYK